MSSSFVFTGGDPRDYFTGGRVAPGDVRDFPEEPPDDGCWQPATGPLTAPPPTAGVATPPAAPAAPEEV